MKLPRHTAAPPLPASITDLRMRIAIFDTVSPEIEDAVLPCRLEQASATLGPAVLLVLIVPLTVLLLAPLAMIAFHLMADPVARATLMADPAEAARIVAGLALVITLIIWPARALFDRLGRTRIVLIDRDQIRVTDKGLFATREWSRPLSSYLGLAHHVRTTHAGARHELILAHADRKSSVLLAIAPHMSEQRLTALASRLAVPIVPATALYPSPSLPDWPGPRRAGKAAAAAGA